LDRLSGVNARNYVYDGAGNPTQVGNLVYVYNLANRMVSVSSGASATYRVNALGERVAKTVGTTTTRYVYDERGRLLGEYAADGTLIQETVWLDDLPIATLRPSGTGTPQPVEVYYVHADHLGSPRFVTRPIDDSIIWRWDNAEPFGNTLANENPTEVAVFRYDNRFPGQQFDAETGTVYNFFRDYEPLTGRYVQSDPIGLLGGTGTYTYVMNSPVRTFDRYGLDTCGSGFAESFVPDNPLTFPFSYCCRKHDNCYDNCFAMPSKEECDENFCQCMLHRCAKFSYVSGVRLVCERWANTYCRAVTWRGQAAFAAARRQCSQCGSEDRF
jgi:RHS repeat-associated protein